MTTVAMASTGLLQESLLGQAVTDVLALPRLKAELVAACQAMVSPLQRLYLGNMASRAAVPGLTADALVERMTQPLEALHDWVLEPRIMPSLGAGAAGLSDFWHLVLMTHSLGELAGRTPPLRLLHLLGVARVRARLEQHAGLSSVLPTYLVPHPAEHGLSVTEIAALCSLKLSTVRNAVSRREMPFSKQRGVGFDDALDWMVQRSGFLYPHINAATRDRRINGRLAAEWLAASDSVVLERSVSRLRLSIWQLADCRQRIALNTEGVRSCVVLLPGVDSVQLSGLGLEALDDRSADPSATMHREALALRGEETLWQCQVPTMAVLGTLIERLRLAEPQVMLVGEASLG
ncbi:hypothetical protein R6258_00880 [Halomonas sp. HP20-15]|uniref:hypothetical protein n=1 Tax=Halomonas sp. HP20-15 TaxID=3085901 RepID=UPI002980EF2E|nr:hypothetical protein [Halomonas sp. HP20-15]MDW5375460.1 hypothetical protein [Halomonas sp. HP20-15]